MNTENKHLISPALNKYAEAKAQAHEMKKSAFSEIKEEFAELLHRLSNLAHGLDAEERKELLTYEKHQPSLEVLGFQITGIDPSPVFAPVIVNAPKTGKRGRPAGKKSAKAPKKVAGKKPAKALSQSDLIITAINDGKEHHVKEILSTIHKQFDSKFKMQSLRVVLSKLVKLKAIKGLGNGKYKLKG
jgi:hypothetical protein